MVAYIVRSMFFFPFLFRVSVYSSCIYKGGGGFVLLKLCVCVYFHSFAYTVCVCISNATESYHLALKSVLTKYSKILNLQCCCCFVFCFFLEKNNNESFLL
uniref:(northern house mosquito) hypothetical protein n=1 Tax=Culex pipiens TaxID=7175 RepID=A0A8D8P3J3_CULPI